MEVARGVDELQRLLREQTFDLRALDLAGFRAWVGRHLARWKREDVFRQRAGIRDLRRRHPRLRELEAALAEARAADAASPLFARLRDAEWEAGNAAKAVEGLTRAIESAPPEKRPGLQEKLDAFTARVRELDRERDALVRSSPERQELLRAREELDRLRAAIGLDPEEARLAELLTQRGHRTSRHGGTFEELAVDLLGRHVVPELAPGDSDVRVLRGVRLGAAGVEFDGLVVRVPGDGGPVVVLALVEAKRNVNGIAHGFARRQTDLAWLTGDVGRYDPAAHRTWVFPAGHFDRPAEHREAGEVFRFAPGSFSLFRRDPAAGVFLDRLYLVTRAGPIWGVSPENLARIATRVATDEDWDPEDDAYLSRLFDWCRSLAGPVETPEVLRLYAGSPAHANQVLIVRPQP